MPARIPIEVGGVYHIINRGVEKRKIFMKPQDYARFVLGLYFFNDKNLKYDIWTSFKNRKEQTLAILGKPGDPRTTGAVIDERERWVDLLAFTLMPNHFHLIIKEFQEGGISSFMQKMGGYSRYFNEQYDRVGPLFQGRYKAIAIKDERQLGVAFVYVHTNPVELREPEWKDLKVTNARNALNSLEHYRWSSLHDYVGNPAFPNVTQRQFFLDFYGDENSCRQAIDDWVLFKAENAGLDPELFE